MSASSQGDLQGIIRLRQSKSSHQSYLTRPPLPYRRMLDMANKKDIVKLNRRGGKNGQLFDKRVNGNWQIGKMAISQTRICDPLPMLSAWGHLGSNGVEWG